MSILSVSLIGHAGGKLHPVYVVRTDAGIEYKVHKSRDDVTYIQEWKEGERMRRKEIRASFGVRQYLYGVIDGWNSANSTKS